MNIHIWKNGQSQYGKVKILNKTYSLRFGKVSATEAKKMADKLVKELTSKYGDQLRSSEDAFNSQIGNIVKDVGKQLGEKPAKAKPGKHGPKVKRGPRGPYKKSKDTDKPGLSDTKDSEDEVEPLDRKRGLLDSVSKEFNEKIKRIKSAITVTDTEIEYSVNIATALKNHFDIGASPEHAGIFWKWISDKSNIGWRDFRTCNISVLKKLVNEFLKEIK